MENSFIGFVILFWNEYINSLKNWKYELREEKISSFRWFVQLNENKKLRTFLFGEEYAKWEDDPNEFVPSVRALFNFLYKQYSSFKKDLFNEIFSFLPNFILISLKSLKREYILKHLVINKNKILLRTSFVAWFYTFITLYLYENKKFFKSLFFEIKQINKEISLKSLKREYILKHLVINKGRLDKNSYLLWFYTFITLYLYENKKFFRSLFLTNIKIFKEINYELLFFRKNKNFFIKKFYLFIFYFYVYSYKFLNFLNFYSKFKYVYLLILLVTIYLINLSVSLILSLSVVLIFVLLLNKFVSNFSNYNIETMSHELVTIKKFINLEKNKTLFGIDNSIYFVIFYNIQNKFVFSAVNNKKW